MKNNFSCPNCQSKQRIKHLFFFTNSTTWHCHQCNTVLKPKKLSSYAIFLISFLPGVLVIVPSFYTIYILKYKLIKALLVGLLFGILAYILAILYYYFNVKLEEV